MGKADRMHGVLTGTRTWCWSSKALVGWSRVDLIAVLGILVVLIILSAVALPMLAQSRETSRQSQCRNNMKTIGQAIVAYRMNNHDYFPFSWGPADIPVPRKKDALASLGCLYPDYLSNVRVFHCPATGTEPGFQLHVGESHADGDREQYNANWVLVDSSYGYDCRVDPRISGGSPIAADMDGSYKAGDDTATQNHTGAQNVLFADGSVKWLKMRELNSLGPGTEHIYVEDPWHADTDAFISNNTFGGQDRTPSSYDDLGPSYDPYSSLHPKPRRTRMRGTLRKTEKELRMLPLQYPLFVLPEKVEARWINPENITGAKGAGGKENDGRKGAPSYGAIKAGEQVELANYQGSSGIIRHLWTTIDERSPKMLRGLRMDFYWDGADTPAISAPWGDFFGFGLGAMEPFECAIFNSPEGRNFNSFVPMPFRSGFRITVTNETDTDVGMFWFHADFTIHDDLPANALYLHAYYHRENPTTMRQDYEFLPPVKGSGRYLGVNFGVIADTQMYFKSWWGEGEVKIYIDGDREFPTLCGTGTEDYIMTSWGQGHYANAYSGCHLADHENLRFCFYRYHLPDPIYFRQEIRATIQQIGNWHMKDRKEMYNSGNAYFKTGPDPKPLDLSPTGEREVFGFIERADDWSSCAYFYLDSPTNDLPPLDPVAKRIEGLE